MNTQLSSQDTGEKSACQIQDFYVELDEHLTARGHAHCDGATGWDVLSTSAAMCRHLTQNGEDADFTIAVWIDAEYWIVFYHDDQVIAQQPFIVLASGTEH